MKVLITGARGQLGRDLTHTRPRDVDTIGCDLDELDIGDRDAVLEFVQRHKPAVVVNAAAYTAVDKAEDEKEKAYRANCDGAANVAEAANQIGARVVHVSTDYVFDGTKSSPYRPDDLPGPLGVYGASKAAGEKKVREISNNTALIVRSSWLYAVHGHNFVNTMLRLMGERDEVRVVADQIGCPTWARTLAQAIWSFIAKPQLAGIYHWTDSGVASWYDFAVAVEEEGNRLGLLKKRCSVVPIRTEDYPTRAKRPAYSVLDKTSSSQALGYAPPHWRESLRQMLEEKLVIGNR
jgi:dTDP-4-dehydrorhamnose reductase